MQCENVASIAYSGHGGLSLICTVFNCDVMNLIYVALDDWMTVSDGLRMMKDREKYDSGRI